MNIRHYFEFDERLALKTIPTLSKINWITPNLVTFISLVFPLLGAFLVWQGYSVLGIASFCFGRWLDHVDGALARATDNCTKFGAMFDLVVGFLSFASLFWAIAEVYDLYTLFFIHLTLSATVRFLCIYWGNETGYDHIITRGKHEKTLWGLLFEDELGSLPYWLCGLLSFIFLPIWLFIDIIGLSIGFIWLIWMKSNDKYLNISGDNYGMEKNSSSHNTS